MTTTHDDSPGAIGTPEYVYGHVLNALKEHKVRKVLDCPAGNGAFTIQLINSGFETGACDINNDSFKLGDKVECKYADMNDRLPYADESFDAIVCLNGLHRVWARGRTIGEFARALSTNGTLIITNVNNINLLHRLTYLICGSANYNTLGPPYGFFPNAEVPAAWYRAPLTIAEVVNVGTSAGLSVERIEAISISWKSIALAPLAILAWSLSFLFPKRFHKHCFIKEANSIAGLFSDYVAIVMRKSNE